MVNFASMMEDDVVALPLDPLELFDQLPKSSKISNLYDSQAQVLRKWHEELRESRDVVIELNTGGGKTLIGLLIAMSTMYETEMGVLYLVENRQLARQVVSQGEELGMPIRAYAGKESLDASFDNGECIVVGSYQALFNGRSAFGKSGQAEVRKVGGIIVDDAHASLEAVRDAFSLSIPAADEAGLYKTLLSEFRIAFELLELESTYHDFYAGVGGIANDRVVEIPFWEWAKVQSQIAGMLSEEYAKRLHEEDAFSINLRLHWPLLQDNLKYCQVTVSRRAITISSIYPLVHLFPTFTDTKRRVFMSATINDYGDMVRAYDLRGLEDKSVIAPTTSAGIGRRMILPLKSEIACSDSFANLIAEEVGMNHGVVRLVPRRGVEEEWRHPDVVEPIGHEEVDSIVEELIGGKCQRMVSFVNRYNGIDLPDDSCRVLIMRDLPSGRNDSEELLAYYLSDSTINSQRIAQRIEQGVGRGVRSGSDHCVVLLEGSGLIDWINRKKNRQHFSVSLRAQLDMGMQADLAITNADEYCDAIRQDLSSEATWKAYHSKALSQAIKRDSKENDPFGGSFEAACAERRAFSCWREHQVGRGVLALRKTAELEGVDPQFSGWLLQLAARMCFDGDVRNADVANVIQRKAHSRNTNIPYYPFATKMIDCKWAKEQAVALLELLEKSKYPVNPLQAFDDKLASLVHKSPSKRFEVSLVDLGSYLGFRSEKHDREGRGSDVIWISPDGLGFVMEAKNEKDVDTPLHKAEAGQLRTARDWFMQLHPDLDALPISVHPSKNADANASASNLYVLTLTNLSQLREEVRRLVEEASACLQTKNADELVRYIVQCGLGGHDIAEHYLESFR